MQKIIKTGVLFTIIFSFFSSPALAATESSDAAMAVTGGIAGLSLLGFTGGIMLFSIVFGLLQLIMVAAGIALLVLWVWMLIDVIQRDDKDFPNKDNSNEKLMWLLIILFTSYIGGAIYYYLVYRKMQKK